jgi:hypothetical protein
MNITYIISSKPRDLQIRGLSVPDGRIVLTWIFQGTWILNVSIIVRHYLEQGYNSGNMRMYYFGMEAIVLVTYPPRICMMQLLLPFISRSVQAGGNNFGIRIFL